MNSIPVLYYHSVADHKTHRPWSFLSCPVEVFKAQMIWLKKNGYNTCFWNELFEHTEGTKKLPEKTINIQFDDGFLDNWSVVFPIMKELGLKYTVLLTPDFIDLSGEIRPFVKSTDESNILDWWGYLNSAEIKKMAESGIVEFQAHGFTHTWYECSDEIIDVFDGTQLYPHLFWNRFEKEKPFWLTIDWKKKIPTGYPVFKFEKSLNNINRFYPSQEFIDECIGFDEKVEKDQLVEEIKTLAEKYKNEGKLGRFETKDEWISRINHELADTKRELEIIVSKPVDFIVWPGGGNNEEVINMAFEAGYKMVSKGKELNSFNSRTKKISRVAGFIPFPIFNKRLNLLTIKLQILRAQGSIFVQTAIETVRKTRSLIK